MQEITATDRSVRFDLRRVPALSKQQIPHAELPALYKAAVAAMRDCWRIDELKDIADKHAAIAHYAKQAGDKTLMWYAERIQLRAFERIAELMHEIAGENQKDVAKAVAAAKQGGLTTRRANGAFDAGYAQRPVRDELIEARPPAKEVDLVKAGRAAPTHPRVLFPDQFAQETPEGAAAEKVLMALRAIDSVLGPGLDRLPIKGIARAVAIEQGPFVWSVVEKLCELHSLMRKPRAQK